MNRKTIKVNDWLKANCQYKGCIYNDGFGSCLVEDEGFVDEMLDIVHESYKDGEEIPEDKTFICTNADFISSKCELCGSELAEHKEYPTGERQFHPVIYEICTNKDCEESVI